MDNEFSTFDIVKLLGINREKLRDWMDRGYVNPSIPAEGQGTRAVFVREDIYNICLFVELLKIGFKRKFAANIISNGIGDKSNFIKVFIDTEQLRNITDRLLGGVL